MKEKFKKIIGLFMAIALLAGCTMKENIGLTIESNGDISISMIIAMDDEMIDGMLSMKDMDMSNPDASDTDTKTYTDAERWAYIEGDDEDSAFSDLPDDFKKTRYEKDGFKGVQANKELGKIDDVSASSASARVNILNSEEDSDFTKSTLFIKDGNKYKSNMTIDLGSEASDMSQYEAYGAAFDLKFTITLPEKPISNNATEVSADGKTLSWDLLKAKDIEVEFELDGSSSGSSSKEESKDSKKDKDEDKDDSKSKILLYVGIGAGVLVLLVIIIAVIASSKKKKAQNAEAAMVQNQTVMAPNFNQPVEPPVQPIQPVQPVQPVQPAEPTQTDQNNTQQ